MDVTDQREFYRLPDNISVDYRLIPPSALLNSSPSDHFELPDSFHWLREVYELEMEATELLRGIADKQRMLGAFLHNLNRRMEILSRSAMARDSGIPEVNQETYISEGGLSFLNGELVREDSRLALQLVFHPSLLGLTCFAEVRDCRLSEDGGQYRVGVRFLDLDMTSQRLISRHIIRRQSEERRKRLRQDKYDNFL
ncbi:MAG: PilZ domain-containing protein [Pseudomonadales bacterium]|nr:PilZ domain-containing protein [Pseudomonadales bacterium]